MPEEMELLFDFDKELKKLKSEEETIHKGVSEIIRNIPTEYAGSATFSLVIDAARKKTKIFSINTKLLGGPILTKFSKK